MILLIIRGNKLEGFLDGSRPCPPKFNETENGQTINEKFEEWHVMDQLLLGWLYRSLYLEIAAQLINCRTRQELWMNIQELAGSNTKAKIMWYKNELQRTRKGFLKMKEYLNKTKEFADNLQLAGCTYSLNDLFTQILSSLDSEYTPIVVQLTHTKEEMPWIEF